MKQKDNEHVEEHYEKILHLVNKLQIKAIDTYLMTILLN
jgi:tetrahydromethanopterin S-methyltransferase subunit F